MENVSIKKTRQSYFFFKRLFDIVLSIFLILALSWLFLLILIINLFATKGRPIFVDQRCGQYDKPIGVLKFRSMLIDAETEIQKYLNEEQLSLWEAERKIDNDPRVTTFGRFLRKTSLDELPQLFNILVGNMSFVGPRPITERELHYFSDSEAELLLSAKPGLTGYWAVFGRSEVSFTSGKRQKLELSYFKHRSLFYDAYLFFKTIPAVLSQKGAR